MRHDSERQCPHKTREGKKRRRLVTLALVAIASTIWFAVRTGTKPSRIFYPCQQAALANISLFKTVAAVSLPSIASLRATTGTLKPIMILALLSMGGFIMATDPVQIGFEPLQVDLNIERVPIVLTEQTAVIQENASDLFYVQNATGPDGNMDSSVSTLIELMDSQGLHFYNTSTIPDGLIKGNDVIIIKINGQWPRRGGTNTDLIKSVINAIHDHPDGFTGEVVIADNGQGSGSLDYSNPNSYYQNQSTQDMVDSFAPEWNVSTILWDDLHFSTVDDYNDGDFTDGYVRSSVWNEEMQLYTSYPKFQSPATGAYISFKQGVWYNGTGFDYDGLKILNMPVLKSHELLGVTSCVKHYMGVPQGYIVGSISSNVPHEHFSVRSGGMGTMIVETRAPDLNILDMVWVNANPLESSSSRGPWSTYTAASATDIIGASVDPVALDYYSAKHVLVPTAVYLNYSSYSSLDPDYEPISEHIYSPMVEQEESFHNYLERSMNEMKDAGFDVTMDEAEMNVFVIAMTDAGPVTPTTPEGPGPMNYLPVVIGTVALVLLVVAAAIIKRRAT
ncbi:MAG: DUF362 domain-containing protein [Candidatus Thorarchaeota archaeon]|jgi:hypothetical protein